MLPLSATVIEQKNLMGSTEPVIMLLELVVPSLVDPIRLARNNEDVTWNTVLYQAFPWTIDDIADSADGEIPQVNIQIANASRAIEKYLIDYDVWLKLNSHVPIVATISIVSTADLLNATPIASFEFEVSHFNANAKTATFFLTQKNIYALRFPPNRAVRKCRWKFGSVQCGVTPTAGQTCNKTLTDCRAYNNEGQFGGFPSIGGGLEKVISE